MAQNDDATLVVSTGTFYTAAVGTALPTDLSAVPVAWTSVGHTSLSDIFGASSDGGDATTVGTLQNASLRTKYAPRTESFKITLQQWDTESLKLFYGSNASVGTAGEVQVPANPVPTVAAFLAVFEDGANTFAMYAPKAEIYRGDDLSIADTESLAGLPLSVKPMIHSTNDWTYAVTPLGDEG